MRGRPSDQLSMLTLRSPEQMIRKDHPLREVKALADKALGELEPVFAAMYSDRGRESIPPERLLKSSLLIALYSVRSERLFCEQLDYNMLFRWFLDMDFEDVSFDHSSFTKNRERLMQHEVAAEFFDRVLAEARRRRLLGNEHFSVDGTLIEAWASLKSFRRKDEKKQPPPDDPGNPTVDFHGEKRSNETHESKTDPDAKLARKGPGKEARLCHAAHGIIENRNGLLVAVTVTAATGRAEVEAAGEMATTLGGDGRITLGADKNYDTREFVTLCRAGRITPHVAQKKRYSAIDGRTTRHAGYAVSQRFRKRIEEVWGWMKMVAGFRKTRFRGRDKTGHEFVLAAAAYNLVRMANLTRATA